MDKDRIYQEGSEACRNYSQLTMRVRTLALQVLGVMVVGAGAIFSTKEGLCHIFKILFSSGIIMVILAISFWYVDWHYQSAFTSIRNCLARLEHENGMDGPWKYHLQVRGGFNDHLASYLPFLFLILLGFLGIYLGMSDTMSDWNIIPVLLAGLSVIIFLYNCRKAYRNDYKNKNKYLVDEPPDNQ